MEAKVKPGDCVFRASCDGAELIASGTIIPLNDKPIDISIPMGDDALTLRIAFRQDEKDKASRYGIEVDESNFKLVKLCMVNLNSPLGGGPSKPIALWRNPTSEIILMFRMFTQLPYPPIIHFSFYMKALELTKPETGQ